MYRYKIKNWHINLFLIGIILILNPVFWLFDKSISVAYPDTLAYITLAQELMENGSLFLSQYAHIDSGQILAPLYPFLIAVGMKFLHGGLLTAEFVSSVCIISSTFPLFFFTSRLSSKLAAFLATLLIQINYYYLFFGMSGLTEATFIMILSVGFFLFQQYIFSENDNHKKILPLTLGVTASLIVLTRHAGICFIIALLFFNTLRYVAASKSKKCSIRSSSVYIITGFLLIIIPYNIALYQQTGKVFLTTKFRLGEYSVSISESELSTIPPLDQDDYNRKFIQRRELRRLNADGSEMLGMATNVIEKDQHSAGMAMKKFTADPLSFFHNLLKNIHNLAHVIGWLPTVIFLISLTTTCWIKVNDRVDTARKFLAFYILIYFLFISFVSEGIIERYIAVMYPFIIVQIMIEIHSIAYRFSTTLFQKYYRFIIAGFACLAAVSTPELPIGVKTVPKIVEEGHPYEFCGKLIERNAPVFSFHPFNTYYLGGWFRVLPNDTLDKIAIYAHKTGVKWMILVNTPGENIEHGLYTHAPWLNEIGRLGEIYPDIVRLRCGIYNQLWLYEFNEPYSKTE